MKFSIGIPAYKAKFLAETIQSVLQQSVPDFELIIVNDKSPEDLDQIVYSFDDKRIRYFKNKENCGAVNVVDNWNICLSYAQGTYFLLLGDDDLLEPQYLATMSDLIHRFPQTNVYHCRSYIIDENSDKYDITPSWPEQESVYDSILHRIQYGRMQYISDFLYNTQHLKSNNGFYKLPLAWGSDDITAYRAAIDYGIAHTNKPVFCYRVSNITLSKSGNSAHKLNAYKAYNNWVVKFLKKHNPTDTEDIIIKRRIKELLPLFYSRKKILTVSHSLRVYGVKKIFFWFSKRKAFELSTPEIIKGFFRYLIK